MQNLIQPDRWIEATPALCCRRVDHGRRATAWSYARGGISFLADWHQRTPLVSPSETPASTSAHPGGATVSIPLDSPRGVRFLAFPSPIGRAGSRPVRFSARSAVSGTTTERKE